MEWTKLIEWPCRMADDSLSLFTFYIRFQSLAAFPSLTPTYVSHIGINVMGFLLIMHTGIHYIIFAVSFFTKYIEGITVEEIFHSMVLTRRASQNKRMEWNVDIVYFFPILININSISTGVMLAIAYYFLGGILRGCAGGAVMRLEYEIFL